MEIARRRNLYIISDEIYEDYVYEGGHYSFLEHSDRRDHVILVVFEDMAVPGFRLGILVARREIIKKIELLATNMYSCSPASFQYGSGGLIRSGEEYRRRRDLVWN